MSEKIQLEINKEDVLEVFEILCEIPFLEPRSHDCEPPNIRHCGIESIIEQLQQYIDTELVEE